MTLRILFATCLVAGTLAVLQGCDNGGDGSSAPSCSTICDKMMQCAMDAGMTMTAEEEQAANDDCNSECASQSEACRTCAAGLSCTDLLNADQIPVKCQDCTDNP